MSTNNLECMKIIGCYIATYRCYRRCWCNSVPRRRRTDLDRRRRIDWRTNRAAELTAISISHVTSRCACSSELRMKQCCDITKGVAARQKWRWCVFHNLLLDYPACSFYFDFVVPCEAQFLVQASVSFLVCTIKARFTLLPVFWFARVD